jgi:hypothetical protein
MIKIFNKNFVVTSSVLCFFSILGSVFLFYYCFVLGDSIVSSKELTISAPVNTLGVCDDPNTTNPYCKGSWTAPQPAPVTAVHSFVLPNGKVMMFTSNNNNYDTTKAYTWDPNSQNFTNVTFGPTTNGNLFCAGHDFLQDGRLLLSGGHLGINSGFKDTTVFDYRNSGTASWLRFSAPNTKMNDGRWYPSNCTLGNGEQLLMMGNSLNGGSGVYNNDLEIWRNRNKISRLPNDYPSDAEINYPFSFLNKYGLVFIAGPVNKSFFINPKNGVSFTSENSLVALREYGSAVMYKAGSVLITGGRSNAADGSYPYKSAEKIDIDNVSSNCGSNCPSWTSVDDMNFKRSHHNATILPDGKVLVTGGSNGTGFSNHNSGVLEAEIWDSTASPGYQWKPLAGMQRQRLYHSTAVLLPSGKVLVGGGDWILNAPAGCSPEPFCEGGCTTPVCEGGCTTPGVTKNYYCNLPESNIEVFSPPYLFNSDGTAATRPVITSAPINVGYNKKFSIGVNTSSISKVTMVKLSAVTHSFNQGQRFNDLQFSIIGNELKITSPVNGNHAPPGFYMLFVINSGVPSEAKIIQITDKEASNKFDFDEDRKTDISVWRPASSSQQGNWYNLQSTNNQSVTFPFGSGTDQPVPGDYDGDGINDYAIRRASSNASDPNQWTVRDSSDGTVNYYSFGSNGDIAVPADYDGDRLTDIAIWRPSTGEWAVLKSSDGAIQQTYPGTQSTDLPVPGYYDDDSKADIAFWRPSNGNWYITRSATNQQQTVQFGTNGDYVVPNDYDGDTMTDIAVWRPSNSQWTILNSSDNSVTYYTYGLGSDIPVSKDYDGDGKADVAIWRPSTGEWAIFKSSTASSSLIYYGAPADIPIPSVYYRH